MSLEAAIGSFFVEYSKFEMLSIGAALRSLSRDPQLVEQAEKLLDLDARLKLLERMAFVRRIPEPLMRELKSLMKRARKLHDVRNDVAVNLTAPTLSLPAIASVDKYAADTIDLQATLRAITAKFDAHLIAQDVPPSTGP